MDILKKFDNMSPDEPKVNPSSLGGALNVAGWLFVIVYTAFYIYETSMDEYPHNITVNPFPINKDDPNPFMLPAIQCIAPSGCYYVEHGTNMCKWYAKDSFLPPAKLLFTGMPVISVLIIDPSSPAFNSGLRYSMTRMTKATNPIETSTTDFIYDIPKGMSTMAVERIKGVEQKNGSHEFVETWLSSLTQDLSSFSEYNHACCGATVFRSNGIDWVTDNTKTTEMTNCTSNLNNWWTTRINAPSYYTLLTISDPLSISVILGLIGGWMGTIFAAAVSIYYASTFFHTQMFGIFKEAQQSSASEPIDEEIEFS